MKRYENLDGLRAISCMGIVAMHLYCTAGYAGGGGALDSVISSWASLVIPFMMLSGFGICAGYLERFQQSQTSLEKFYMRRYSKILPFFLVTTLIGVVAEHSLRGIAEGLIELSLVFGFLPNNSNCFNVNGVCWTLGTIFAFYLLFPFVSVLLKNKKRAWMALAASVVVQFLCETLFMTEVFVLDNYLNRSNVLYSMTFFLTGGLLYLYREDIARFVKGKHDERHGKRQWLILLACIASTVAYYLTPDKVFGVRISDQKVVLVFVLWCVYAIGSESFVLNNRLVKGIAKYSMEIYLSHMITLKVLRVLKVAEIMGKNIAFFLIMFVLLMVVTLAFVVVVNFGIAWVGKRVRGAYRSVSVYKT